MNSEANLFYKRGVQAILNQDYDASEFFLLKSIEIDDSELNYGCLAWLYGTVYKQEEKGLRYFRKAIRKNPRQGDLYNDYGALLLKTGRLHDSIKWFGKAIRLASSKKKHFAFYNLALVYRDWKKPKRSLRYLQLALRHKADFQEARKLYFTILKETQYIETKD